MATVLICAGLGILICIIWAFVDNSPEIAINAAILGCLVGAILGFALALIIGFCTNPGDDGYNMTIEHHELMSSEVDGVTYYAFLNTSPRTSYQFFYLDDGTLIQDDVDEIELNIIDSVKPSIDIKRRKIKDGYIWGFYFGGYTKYYLNLPDKDLLYIQTGSG